MDSEDIINQYTFAVALSTHLELSNSTDAFSILNALASEGIKLCKLNPDLSDDFDDEGTSIVSKAYMYSVVENIEMFHMNKNNLNGTESEDYFPALEEEVDSDELELTDDEIDDIFGGGDDVFG